jgi:hypothetical protein
MRSTSGGSISSTSDINTSQLIQETPSKLAKLLTSTVSSPAKTQLLSGGITIDIIEEWKNTLPSRIHQKIYRGIHLAIITHQHDIWLKRNEVAHPEQELPQPPPDYNRKRRVSHITDLDETIPADTQWKRARKNALTAEDAWSLPAQKLPVTSRKRRLALLANPTARPRKRTRTRRRFNPMKATLTCNQHGENEEVDSSAPKDTRLVHTQRDTNSQGPSAPDRSAGRQITPSRGPISGQGWEGRGSDSERSQGTQGPPPSATGGGRVRFPRATGQ